jgi:hypothetical protein
MRSESEGEVGTQMSAARYEKENGMRELRKNTNITEQSQGGHFLLVTRWSHPSTSGHQADQIWVHSNLY